MRLDCMSHLGNTNETGRMGRRCGCRVQRVENKCVLRLYKQFRCYTRQEVNTRDFGGVLYKDLVYAEECFDLHATVLALQPYKVCTVERRSWRPSGTELSFNAYQGNM